MWRHRGLTALRSGVACAHKDVQARTPHRRATSSPSYPRWRLPCFRGPTRRSWTIRKKTDKYAACTQMPGALAVRRSRPPTPEHASVNGAFRPSRSLWSPSSMCRSCRLCFSTARKASALAGRRWCRRLTPARSWKTSGVRWPASRCCRCSPGSAASRCARQGSVSR